MPAAATQTLSQDWQLRRQRLEAETSHADPALLQAQLRVLDYLLKKYADAPDGARPARFPAHGQLDLRRRAIVVHFHLNMQGVAGIKTEGESRVRLGAILQRIKSLELQSEAKVPQSTILTPRQPDTPVGETALPAPPVPEKPVISRAQLPAWMEIGAALRYPWNSRWTVYQKIDAALKVTNVLPDAALEFLSTRITAGAEDAVLAVEFMLRCEQPEVLSYGMEAWRTRLSATGDDHVTQRLGTIFLKEIVRERAPDALRAQLASENATVRIEVLKKLSNAGTLDDIGLLLDLLALPKADDEHANEREQMMATVVAISGAG
jgi:hypothetical protein